MKQKKIGNLINFVLKNSNLRMITTGAIQFIVGIMLINCVVYSSIWKIWLEPYFEGKVSGSFLWYYLYPLSIETVLLSFVILWFWVGHKTQNTDFPESHFYVIIGSLLFTTEFSVMVYFYRSFSYAPLYFATGLLVIPLYKSRKWAIYICSFTFIEAVIVLSNLFEIDTYRIDHMPLGADIVFSTLLVLLVSIFAVSIFFINRRANDSLIRMEGKEKAKSELLASMSHEIRTPINAILGMNEMISRVNENAEITEYSANIQSSGNALLSLINDVLDYSKMETGKIPLNETEYLLSDLIKDSYLVVIQRAESKGLSLILDVDSNLPSKFSGDEGRIRQILINLLTNAVKYTEKGKVILRVRSWEENKDTMTLLFEVEDTGIGIAKENLPTLFDPFTRFDEKKNAAIEGSGLGLAIVQKLTTFLSGKISVASDLEQGSIFALKIPEKVIDRNPIGDIYYHLNKEKKKEYHALFTAPTAEVLAVDDVNVNLLVLKGLLKDTKVKITDVDSGRKAIELIKVNHYDIILMDHLMPEMDGVEALKFIKALGEECPNYNTPIIVLTANALADSRAEYLAMGFTDYIPKPVDGKELENMLLKYLPKKLIEQSE